MTAIANTTTDIIAAAANTTTTTTAITIIAISTNIPLSHLPLPVLQLTSLLLLLLPLPLPLLVILLLPLLQLSCITRSSDTAVILNGNYFVMPHPCWMKASMSSCVTMTRIPDSSRPSCKSESKVGHKDICINRWKPFGSPFKSNDTTFKLKINIKWLVIKLVIFCQHRNFSRVKL